jgi:hypothetical protein
VSYGGGVTVLGAVVEWGPDVVTGAASAIGARPIEQPIAVAGNNDATYLFVVFMMHSPVC